MLDSSRGFSPRPPPNWPSLSAWGRKKEDCFSTVYLKVIPGGSHRLKRSVLENPRTLENPAVISTARLVWQNQHCKTHVSGGNVAILPQAVAPEFLRVWGYILKGLSSSPCVIASISSLCQMKTNCSVTQNRQHTWLNTINHRFNLTKYRKLS